MANHAEAEKKPVYKKAWFWILIIIVVAIIGIGASDAGSNIVPVSGQESKTTGTTEKTEYNQGEKAKLGNGAVTVTKVERSQGGTYDKPKSGKEFVIVSVTINNEGNSNLSYNPFYFKLQNSQGQQESQTFTTVNSDTALNSGELVSGGTVSGTIAFEAPKGDTGLVLIYSDSIWSSKELKITLQ